MGLDIYLLRNVIYHQNAHFTTWQSYFYDAR